MRNRITNLDDTCSIHAAPRQELVDLLEQYAADLERGVQPDHLALAAAHPELADELLPYLESLQMIDGATRELRTKKNVEGDAEKDEASPPASRQIGEYRIVREIGRGGMGIVYEAHQVSLNRQVALKILPFAAVLDQRQIARFRNEAQAAAQLHHPHIVPVFAVGQEQGVYYYAMQYIEGQSLEQAIAGLRKSETPRPMDSTRKHGVAGGSSTTLQFRVPSTVASRQSIAPDNIFHTVARLGREAAEALQHAHEHGIVHRDVKPSNLLIDSRGKLWVTDFGLARIQSNNGVTLTGDVVGTLRYMSPEQASGSPLVDAQTDVYSLGVTLYELLTQSHAHPSDERHILLRQIVNDEPIPPRKLNPTIPVDLETIVLSAMAKSRHDRYASAQALADDLERFLEGKPTLARRPSLADRMGKWARRHRALVAVAACSMLLLSIISAVGMVLLAREQSRTTAALADAEQSAHKSQENFERAERYFRQARAAVDQFGMRLSDRLVELPGSEPVRRDLLLDTLNYYRQFAVDADNDPTLRQETAVAHFKSAVLAAKLGAVNDAIKEYRSSQKTLEDLVKAKPDAVEPRAQLAVSHNNLGLLYAARSETERARREYSAAIDLQKQLTNERPDDPELVSQLADSEANLGLLLDQVGDTKGAEQSLRGAVDVLLSLSQGSSGAPKLARDVAIAYNNLSYVMRNRNPAEAAKASEKAIAILERLSTQGAASDYQDDLALCYNNRAALDSQKGAWNDAIQWHQQAIALQEQMVRKSPAVVRHRSDLAISLNNLGLAYCRVSKTSEADAAFGRARDLLSTLANDYPDELAYRSSLAALLNNQALALAGSGRHPDAIELYSLAIEMQQKNFQRVPESEMMRDLLSKMYYNFGQSLRADGRVTDATNAALKRRDLWKGNSERLLGVAVELAELGNTSKKTADGSNKAAPKNLDDDVVKTLELAYDGGWARTIDLNAEKRFAGLRSNPLYVEKVTELNARSIHRGAANNRSDGPQAASN